MDGKMKMESGYQSWQIFHQLQRQLYGLSDASAPSPVGLTTVVSVKTPDLSVLISLCALKIARTIMLSDDEYDEDEVEQEIP